MTLCKRERTSFEAAENIVPPLVFNFVATLISDKLEVKKSTL